MKIVNIFDGGKSTAVVPKKVIMYDDEGRKAKEISNFLKDNTRLVVSYKYNTEGRLISELSENYHNEFITHSVEEEFFDNCNLVTKRTTKYFVNNKIDHVSESKYGIEEVKLTADAVEDLFERNRDDDDGEFYISFMEDLKKHILEVGPDEFYFLVKRYPLDEDDDTEDVEYFLVFRITGETILTCTDSYVRIKADNLGSDLPYKQESIEYYKSKTNKNDDYYIIKETYDNQYCRKMVFNTWGERELQYLETEYFYAPGIIGIYTKINTEGELVKRYHYYYNGTDLEQIVDNNGKVIETYQTEEEDSKVLYEYPVVNCHITEYDNYKS